MPEDRIVTNKPMPILLGDDYQHIWGSVVVYEEPDHTEVSITISAQGEDARKLAGYMTTPVPIALSFVPVPVRAHNKEKM